MLFIKGKKESLLYIIVNTCAVFHCQHLFQAVTRQITHEQMMRRMNETCRWWRHTVQELFGKKSGGGRPGLPVPNGLYGLCGRKATFEEVLIIRAQELCESRGGRPGLPVHL